jgi:hypothetical protein
MAYRTSHAYQERSHGNRERRPVQGQADTAARQAAAHRRHGRRGAGERGRRRGDRGGPAQLGAAHRGRGVEHHPRCLDARGEQLFIFVLVFLLVFLLVGVVDVREGSGDLRGVMMAEAPDQGAWLTTILRPAGALDSRAADRLCAALGDLAASSDMVIVNLTATAVSSSRSLARKLLAPAREFDKAGRCLLVVGASPELTAELDRGGVPVVTLAADMLPAQARWA